MAVPGRGCGGCGDAGVAGSVSCPFSTSGITLHVHIFVKTAVQHKGKQVEYLRPSVWFLWQKGPGIQAGREREGVPGGAVPLMLPALLFQGLFLPREVAVGAPEPHSQLKPSGVPKGGCSRLCSPRSSTCPHHLAPGLLSAELPRRVSGNPGLYPRSLLPWLFPLPPPKTFPPPPQGMGTNG